MTNLLRRFVQTAATVINNSYLGFILNGKIFQGPTKSICAPGLNCYSCPASVLACPMGSLQTILSSVRTSLAAGRIHLGLYVIGFMGTIGMIAGRFPCGWLCPFGLLQELMNKIPSKKITIPAWTQYGKYIFLGLFAVILPLAITDQYGYGVTWFCKFVCPAGTLEAGIPLMFLDPSLQRLLGWMYYNKLVILGILLVAMVFIRRPFCRTICPLGGFYSLFNKVSLVQMKHNPANCIKCNNCRTNCPMNIAIHEGSSQLNCIRCFRCYTDSCKFGAISLDVAGVKLPEKFTAPVGFVSKVAEGQQTKKQNQ